MGKKKSLCDLEGHDFISTTAPNFRKCRRSGCTGAECLKNGVWVLVGGKAVTRPSTVRITQSALFHVEASQTNTLTAVDWEPRLLPEKPKTFKDVEKEIIAHLDAVRKAREA